MAAILAQDPCLTDLVNFWSHPPNPAMELGRSWERKGIDLDVWHWFSIGSGVDPNSRSVCPCDLGWSDPGHRSGLNSLYSSHPISHPRSRDGKRFARDWSAGWGIPHPGKEFWLMPLFIDKAMLGLKWFGRAVCPWNLGPSTDSPWHRSGRWQSSEEETSTLQALSEKHLFLFQMICNGLVREEKNRMRSGTWVGLTTPFAAKFQVAGVTAQGMKTPLRKSWTSFWRLSRRLLLSFEL